jgi:hypothetical protein
MGKLEHIKDLLAQIQVSEGESFVVNKIDLAEELNKYDKENSSLIIKVIIVLGAFLGSASLLSFLFITGLIKTPISMTIFGVGLIIVAVFLNNVSKILIFETSFFAMLLYGGFLLIIGLGELKSNGSLNCLYFLIVGLFILFFSKNSIQLFVAILVINGSILWLIHLHKIFWLLHIYHSALVVSLVLVFLNEAKMLTSNYFIARLYNALKSGLPVVLLVSLFMISTKNFIPLDIKYSWLSSIAPIAAILFLIINILKQLEIVDNTIRIVILLFTLIVLGVTALFPALSISILIMLLCFSVNYKTGFVIGALSLAYFIIQFYYDLDYSLLVKSEIMLVSGLLFGGFYFFSSKKLATNENC